MKKTLVVFIKIAILAIILLTMFSNTSKASFWSGIFESGDNFLEEGQHSQSAENAVAQASDEKVQEIISNIYSIIFPLGVVTTVIIGGILGIKFMIASAEDKAKVKESMIPYGIGCVVIYGAFGIWKIAIEIFSALG